MERGGRGKSIAGAVSLRNKGPSMLFAEMPLTRSIRETSDSLPNYFERKNVPRKTRLNIGYAFNDRRD